MSFELVKVVVGMSGGVDSSVAALLLKQQGYDVIGVMLKLWAEEGFGRENQCCSLESANQARSIAGQIGIPFYLMDASDLFYNSVVEPFIHDYLTGLTPNPCALCNPVVRWKMLLQYADVLDAAFVATGHYVQTIRDDEGRVHLFRGIDPKKDQSYIISRLSQNQLSRSLFPIGALEKTQVRAISREFSLYSAEKPDSQDICFIGDGDYRSFLQRKAGDRIRKGAIVDELGKMIGVHDGLPFYTIGQRKGLRISAPSPHYVIGKEEGQNQLIVSARREPAMQRILLVSCNWIVAMPIAKSFPAIAQVRYKSKPLDVIVTVENENTASLSLVAPSIETIACGQIAAIYSPQNEVIGSGRIMETERIS